MKIINRCKLRHLTAIKYLISIVILFWACIFSNKFACFLGLLELFMVFIVTDYIASKNIVVANVVNIILIFIFNIEYVILRFGNTFFSMIMYTNMNSISALSGKMNVYIPAMVTALIGAVIPVTTVLNKVKIKTIIITVIALAITEVMTGGMMPYSSLVQLGNSIYEMDQREKTLSKKNVQLNKTVLSNFYNEKVESGIEKPEQLNSKPNIVLIFTEGLSQNIIEDERDIMPNVRQFEYESISFSNYYNHTAATYRGIIGSLFSAHQLNNNDKNCLISLQSVFKQNGYSTMFLNSEPVNSDFTQYLNDLGFDAVVTDDRYDVVPDQNMYQLLEEELTSYADQPKFITMYTFKTHVAQITEGKKYGDGSSEYLNKFANLDEEFGKFFNFIKKTNTIVIFTTDHATNDDDDFKQNFSGYQREDSFCDRIPLAIWYPGVEAISIDVNGRNSLALAPTILDLLDYESENYFLGKSLFIQELNYEEELINTTFIVPVADWYTSTMDNRICVLDGEDKEYVSERVNEYFTLTIQAKKIVE